MKRIKISLPRATLVCFLLSATSLIVAVEQSAGAPAATVDTDTPVYADMEPAANAEPDAAEQPAPPPPNAAPPVAGPNNPLYWANRLGFSREQYAALARLEESTGVTRCNERRAEISRKYGLPSNTDVEAFKAANRELSPLYARCYLNEGKFWQAFPGLMTPDQRAQFSREVGGRR